MRLHFALTPNRQPVPYNYPHAITGRFHKWIGNNDLHDTLSLYSLGWLQNGHAQGPNLNFPRGATWFISAPDTPQGTALLETIANAALKNPEFAFGMEVVEIHAQPTPDFGPKQVFKANSPIFIRGEKEDGKDPHILFNDPKATTYLTQTLNHKLDKAGLTHLTNTTQITFDPTYKGAKTRLIHIKDDFYKKANVCPVIVEGDPEAVKFAWNTGAGHLTGSGFGSLI